MCPTPKRTPACLIGRQLGAVQGYIRWLVSASNLLCAFRILPLGRRFILTALSAGLDYLENLTSSAKSSTNPPRMSIPPPLPTTTCRCGLRMPTWTISTLDLASMQASVGSAGSNASSTTSSILDADIDGTQGTGNSATQGGSFSSLKSNYVSFVVPDSDSGHTTSEDHSAPAQSIDGYSFRLPAPLDPRRTTLRPHNRFIVGARERGVVFPANARRPAKVPARTMQKESKAPSVVSSDETVDRWLEQVEAHDPTTDLVQRDLEARSPPSPPPSAYTHSRVHSEVSPKTPHRKPNKLRRGVKWKDLRDEMLIVRSERKAKEELMKSWRHAVKMKRKQEKTEYRRKAILLREAERMAAKPVGKWDQG